MAADATRCARPDCISLREELELLRGDLRELAAESDALHDALAAKDADAQRVIAAKDDDLARLTGRVQQLTSQLAAATAAASAPPSSSHAAVVPAAVETPKPAQQADGAADRLARECDELRAANAALETQLRELRAGASAREQAAAAATAAKHAADAKDKRSELLRVLQENELLRGEKGALETALRSTAEVARENEALVKALYAHQSAYKDAVDEQTIEITQLHAKLEQLEREKAQLEAKLIEMDERESDVEALLTDAKKKHDVEKAVLRNELSELQKRVVELEQQLKQRKQQQQQQASESAGGSASSRPAAPQAATADDTDEMEKQLELLQELRIRDKNTIVELNHRVLQQQSDLESLMEHLDVDTAVESAVQSAVAQEEAKSARVRQEHSNMKRRLKEQSELLHEVEFRQAQLEKELAEAREWNAKYERGAGLEDVMKFQKQLRKQLEKQQLANAKLRQELSEQLEATGKFHVAFERLKAECGKAADFQYDDLAVESHLKGELAVNQAVIAQMEHQIQELETDRVRLLQKLREQARVTGQKLFEAHGVTTEQWHLVEEFIDRVRHTPEVAQRMLTFSGGSDGVEGGGSYEQQQLDQDAVVKYETEISNAHADTMKLAAEVARLRSELDRAQTQITLATSRDREDDRHASALRDTDAADDIKQIREQIQLIVREQELQRSERHLLTTKPASVAEDAAIDSLSSSDDEEEEKVKVSKTGGAVKAHHAASLSATSEPLRALADPGSRPDVPDLPSPTHSPSPKQQQQHNWGSVESIAMAVAKALEDKLSLLQNSQRQQRQQQQPQPVADALADVDHQDTRREAALRTTSPAPTATAPATAVDALVFESEEEMTLQLDVLKELNVCLDELVRAEAQNEALQQQLAQHEHAFKAVVDQHTVLYQHFFYLHAEYSTSDEKLQREVAELKSDKHDLQLKCERYESSLHMFAQQREGGTRVVDTETQMRAEIIELTRQTAVYEVNEAKFRRKYQQLHHDLQATRAQKKTLEQDWLEMEKTLKYRILYLESWKQGADELIERMEKTLERSVLKTFAERQEAAATQVLHKYNALSEAYGEMRVKFVQMYDLPNQLSRVQHENALLVAEKRASGGGGGEKSGGGAAADPMLQARINQLEHELSVQIQRVKDMEEAQASRIAGAPMSDRLAAIDNSSSNSKLELYESDVEKENALLFERISEVEQLYESLTRECAKYRDIAALAASQANTLARRVSQENGRRDEREEQARELMAASDDHALVGRLQQQLVQLKTNYQQFLAKYDILAEDQQRAAIRAQHLELELESRSKLLSDVRDKSRHSVAVLETTLSQVKERDLTVRNTKWEAFRRRLDALEEEMRLEQDRRKELEKELEEKQSQLPLLSSLKNSSGESGHSLEVNRLKARIEALETRERVLMGQLESAAKSATYLEQEEMLQAELADTKKLNEDVLRQLKAAQSRITELIKQTGELERSRRQVANEKEDVEIELQHAHAQLELLGGGNQAVAEAEASGRSNQSHSPLMRRKVGLYEKDQADLQQAAQATIASLKLLVEEKNALLLEYQKKVVAVRHDAAHVKAQDRLETTQLNRKLYEENQRMIAQLKDAMATITHLERSGKDKKALQAAQERHEHALTQWKHVEMALEKATQRIKELEMELAVLKNERDIAEARAGEALEEIVLTKDAVAEQEKVGKQLEHQLAFVKRDLAKKEDKMKLLRDAIVTLKEEFLKAEDRHAVEIAKAQQAASVAGSRRTKDRREEAEEQWREDKERLESRVAILQEKLELVKKQAAKRERAAAAKAADKHKAAAEQKLSDSDARDDCVSTQKALENEVARLTRVVKERAANETRVVDGLEKKLRVLEAQNRALREASSAVAAVAPSAPSRARERPEGADEEPAAAIKTREQWENEKKLQRRNELLAARVKEKQSELDERTKELSQAKERLLHAHQELSQLRKAVEQKRAMAASAGAGTAAAAALPAGVKEQIDDLERQNRFLQETLVLKRSEWEEAFSAQTERAERELKRLRRRLSQYGMPDAEALGRSERLRLEEQQYLVSQDVNDELALLGDELQAKEQELIRKDTKLMDAELELETTRLELRRLQRKCTVLESSLQQQQSTRRGVSGPKTKAGGTAIRSPAQERLELEEVIENMKRVIEKLRSENDKLKKHCVSPGKLELLRRKVKEHRSAHEQLECEVERLRAETAELKKEKLRLQQKLRVASSTLTATQQRPGAESEEELRELRAGLRAKEEELAAKEAETRELNDAILELQRQLETSNSKGGDAQEEVVKELEAHVQALADENAKLQSELSAFDEEFFEEIEDLKYKYAQAVREKQQLERRLAGVVH